MVSKKRSFFIVLLLLCGCLYASIQAASRFDPRRVVAGVLAVGGLAALARHAYRIYQSMPAAPTTIMPVSASLATTALLFSPEDRETARIIWNDTHLPVELMHLIASFLPAESLAIRSFRFNIESSEKPMGFLPDMTGIKNDMLCLSLYSSDKDRFIAMFFRLNESIKRDVPFWQDDLNNPHWTRNRYQQKKVSDLIHKLELRRKRLTNEHGDKLCIDAAITKDGTQLELLLYPRTENPCFPRIHDPRTCAALIAGLPTFSLPSAKMTLAPLGATTDATLPAPAKLASTLKALVV